MQTGAHVAMKCVERRDAGGGIALQGQNKVREECCNESVTRGLRVDVLCCNGRPRQTKSVARRVRCVAMAERLLQWRTGCCNCGRGVARWQMGCCNGRRDVARCRWMRVRKVQQYVAT